MRLWLLPTSSEIHRDREIHLSMRMEAKPDKFICVDMVTVLKKKKKRLPGLQRQLQLTDG